MFAFLKDVTAKMDRVNFFKEKLKLMKHKSAPDYTLCIGMNRNTLAIDVRIQNIFEQVGIDFPTAGELGKKSIYDETEKIIKQNMQAAENRDFIEATYLLYF